MAISTQSRGDLRYLKALTGVVRPQDLNPLEAAITRALKSALDRVVVDQAAEPAEPAAVTRSIAVEWPGSANDLRNHLRALGSITDPAPVDLDGGLQS